MEHIISPMFIYWLGVVDLIKGVFVGFAIISFIVIVISFICYIASNIEAVGAYKEELNKKYMKMNKKILKTFIPLLFITLSVCIFTPDKTTLIQMTVADKLTYDTAENILNSGKKFKNEVKQDVIDIINAIGKEDSSEHTNINNNN